MMSHQDLNAVFYSYTYHPIQAGSIDGTDTLPHDNAVCRALLATSTGLYDPIGDPKAYGNPYCVVFVGRLSKDTTESTLQEVMSRYGRIKNLRLVRHVVTGASQGYAFIEYETEKEMQYAYEAAHLIKIDGSQVLVDYNRQLLMLGWIPRRLGGGLGGRKESGQLRFGGRDRPFRKPLRPIPEEELEKLGIPLPGGYMHRYEIPPLPRRKSGQSGAKVKVDENVCEITITGYKRRHDERDTETRRSYEDMDDDRQLNDDRHECRKSSEDRTRNRQHHHEHYDKRDYEQEVSGRTHHHDRRDYEQQHDSGKRSHHHERRDHEEEDSGRRTSHHDRERMKESLRKEDDRRHHHHHKREDDSHGSRRHKRLHHLAAKAPSESYSSETDAGGKARKRPDNDKYDSREPSVDDRWQP